MWLAGVLNVHPRTGAEGVGSMMDQIIREREAGGEDGSNLLGFLQGCGIEWGDRVGCGGELRRGLLQNVQDR
jgi:hypothetical protein